MIFLIVKKWEYKTCKVDYTIVKTTDSLKKANQFLSALNLLEQLEENTYHIVQHDFKAPLILKDEVA
tara:strand:- start:277 stop:477 length:201 start_codon:yes stop_codon:yes gene_type:complete